MYTIIASPAPASRRHAIAQTVDNQELLTKWLQAFKANDWKVWAVNDNPAA